jgi:hypothetical protein
MRISWLEPQVIGIARDALIAHRGTWTALFAPDLVLPPVPSGLDPEDWPRVAEHIARAERVSELVRTAGLDAALSEYEGSEHAIEHATLIAASSVADRLSLDMLEVLLSCEIDELVLYGQFLAMLCDIGGKSDAERSVAVYESFCAAAVAVGSTADMWRDRVAAVRDGLASFYVMCGRVEDGHALFEIRHGEQTSDLVVALAASRSFLSAGAVSRAMVWLGIGAERAGELGRDDMRDRLLAKQESLRSRLD